MEILGFELVDWSNGEVTRGESKSSFPSSGQLSDGDNLSRRLIDFSNLRKNLEENSG